MIKSLQKVRNLITVSMALSSLVINSHSFAQAYNTGNVYITGTVFLGKSLAAGGQADFTNTAAANYLNKGDFYLTGNFTNDQTGMLAGSATVPVTTGTIHFVGGTTAVVNGAQPLNFYNMEMNKSLSATRVDMFQNITTQFNLLLNTGIITTGNYLFTWGNLSGGAITSPGIGTNATLYGESGSGAYTNSYIATCNTSGVPVTGGANNVTRYTGNIGMRINNLGATDAYFPVGPSFYPSEIGSLPSPNRLMIHNYGTPQNYTVAINYGDIGGTPNLPSPKVNRIWYIKSSDTTAATHASDVRLFYTKRNWTTGGGSGWPAGESEVETNFNYAVGALAQKDYDPANNNFINLSKLATGDITSFVGAAYGKEIFAQYTILSGLNLSNRITQFDRFSVVNPSGLILPVTIINFRAYQQGSGVQTEWTCVNEKNIDHYEVQHSTSGTAFASIGSVAALNNGQTSVGYNFYDAHPANGNNFYRIKAIGKDGTVSYTNIEVVNIGGAKSDVTIFPNPVTSLNFILQLTNMPGGKYALLIHNMIGQEILSRQIERLDGSSSETIYLPAGTARGVYKISLINGSTKIIKTITVQ